MHRIKILTITIIILVVFILLNSCSAMKTISIQTNRDLAIMHYNKGLQLEKEEKHSEAFKEFTKAIEFDPNFSKAYFFASFSQLCLSNIPAAYEYSIMTINIDPSYADAYQIASMCLMKMEKYAEAIEILKRLIVFKPDEKHNLFYKDIAYIYYLLGTSFAILNDSYNAKLYFGKFLEIERQYSKNTDLVIIVRKYLDESNDKKKKCNGKLQNPVKVEPKTRFDNRLPFKNSVEY